MPADPSGDRAHAVWHYRYPHHPAMGEAVFAAVRKSAFGTKRTYRDDLLIVRFWSRADIGRVRCLLRPTRMTHSGHERAPFAAMHGLTCYTPHDPWVCGQRDEAARVHYAPQRRGRRVAAGSARAAAGDARRWHFGWPVPRDVCAVPGVVPPWLERNGLPGGPQPRDRIALGARPI